MDLVNIMIAPGPDADPRLDPWNWPEPDPPVGLDHEGPVPSVNIWHRIIDITGLLAPKNLRSSL
jgi:hypothetical protein